MLSPHTLAGPQETIRMEGQELGRGGSSSHIPPSFPLLVLHTPDFPGLCVKVGIAHGTGSRGRAEGKAVRPATGTPTHVL